MVGPNDGMSPEHPDNTLTPQMEIVIDRLIGGSRVVDAAAAAGVDRTTVHRWKRDHSGFQAALNRRRRELHDGLQLRREALAEQALNNVANAVAAGDLQASRYVLDRLALPPAAPPTRALEDPLYLRIMADLREIEDFETHQQASQRVRAAQGDDRLAEYEKTHPGATRVLRGMVMRLGLDGTWHRIELERLGERWKEALRRFENDQAEREAHEDPDENEGEPGGTPETS